MQSCIAIRMTHRCEPEYCMVKSDRILQILGSLTMIEAGLESLCKVVERQSNRAR